MADKENMIVPSPEDAENAVETEAIEEIEEAELADTDAEDIDELMALDGADAELTDEEACAEAEASKSPKTSLMTTVFEWIEMFAVYLSLGIAVLMLLIRHCPVSGDSMMNTLHDGDMLVLYTLAYTPENGDIIVCQSERYGLDRPLVKRVIATEGQTVKIDYDNWTVTVDGEVLREDYILKREGRPMLASDHLENEFTVPEGQVFVMGDNRNGSKDSRSSEIGFIDERYVVGKVWMRVLPIADLTVFD